MQTKTKTEWDIQMTQLSEMLNPVPKPMNLPVPLEVASDSVYIAEDIEIDSDDPTQVSLIKETYKKSLEYYKRVENVVGDIKDNEFLKVVSELQLIMRNILLKFNEKPHRIIQHNYFIDYYQEKFAKFVENFVDMTSNSANQDMETINKIKEIVSGLKTVFKSEFNSISETDMTDLSAEIKTMEQSMEEYVNNIDKTVPEATLKTNISANNITSESYQRQKKEQEKALKMKENTINFSIGVGIGIATLLGFLSIIILIYVFLF